MTGRGNSRSALLACAAFVVIAAIMAGRTLWHRAVDGAPELPLNGLQDFRDAVYYPVRALLDGRNPYDPAMLLATYPVGAAFPLYAPITLLLHLPLGLLAYDTAAMLYLLANVALVPLLAALALAATRFEITPARVMAIAALILLSRPGQWNVFTGQCTVYVVAATYVALLYSRRVPWLAGAGLAVAALKPTYAVPLAALLLVRRDYAAVVAGLVMAGVSNLAMLIPLIANAGGRDAFIASLRANHEAFADNHLVASATSPYRVDAVALFERITGDEGAWLGLAVSGAVLTLAAATVARLERVDGHSRAASNSVITLAVLICIYHLTYDALILALPVLVTLAQVCDEQRRSPRPSLAVVMLGLLAVPALNYVASDAALTALRLDRTSWWIATSASGIACLAAFLCQVRLVHERGTAAVRDDGIAGDAIAGNARRTSH